MEKEGSYYTQVAIIGGGISGTALLFMLSRYTNIESVTLFEKYDFFYGRKLHYPF